MKKYIISSLLLCSFLFVTSAYADKHKDGTSSKKEETVIIKKNGNDPLTVIEITKGNIYVNGEKIASLNNENINTIQRKIIIDSNHDLDSSPSFSMRFAKRKAMLGVFSNPESDDDGAVVTQVRPNSPADKAGLEQGDVITQVDNEVIHNSKDLVAAISKYNPDDNVTIYYNRDGQKQQTQAQLTKIPEKWTDNYNPQMPDEMYMPNPMMPPANLDPGNNFHLFDEHHPKLGAIVEERADGNGVRIMDVKPGSPAEAAGLQKNDIVLEVDRQKIASINDLQNTLESISSNEKVELKYERSGRTIITHVVFPKALRKKEL